MSSKPPLDPFARQQDPVPNSILDLSSISEPDYVDLFTLTTTGEFTWSAEEWARAMFGDVPDFATLVIFRGILGLRVSRQRSRELISGMAISGRGEDWLRLEAHSKAITDNLVVQAGPQHVSLATFMQYHRRSGKWRWTPTSAVHRRIAPGLLRSAWKDLQSSHSG